MRTRLELRWIARLQYPAPLLVEFAEHEHELLRMYEVRRAAARKSPNPSEVERYLGLNDLWAVLALCRRMANLVARHYHTEREIVEAKEKG